MSGTWKKEEELEIIKTGSIWYKKATIHDSAIEITGKTAIVWNRITLESVVRGNDAKVEFTVYEHTIIETSLFDFIIGFHSYSASIMFHFKKIYS